MICLYSCFYLAVKLISENQKLMKVQLWGATAKDRSGRVPFDFEAKVGRLCNNENLPKISELFLKCLSVGSADE